VFEVSRKLKTRECGKGKRYKRAAFSLIPKKIMTCQEDKAAGSYSPFLRAIGSPPLTPKESLGSGVSWRREKEDTGTGRSAVASNERRPSLGLERYLEDELMPNSPEAQLPESMSGKKVSPF
jgi:hypothetical protein